MVKRIEFFGPMGSGKSTICNFLINKVDQGIFYPLVVSSDAQEKKRILLKEARKISLLHWMSLSILGKIPTIENSLITKKITASAWKSLEANTKNYGPLLDHALHFRSSENVDLFYGLKRMSWFIREITDVALFEEYAFADAILHDQSLLQCGLAFSFGYEQGKEFLEKYLRLVPKAALVIYVSGHPDILSARLKIRDGQTSRHFEHLKESITLSSFGVEVLRKRGIPVIEFEENDGISEKLEYCISEFKNFFSTMQPTINK